MLSLLCAVITEACYDGFVLPYQIIILHSMKLILLRTGGTSRLQKAPSLNKIDAQQGNSFAFQIFQPRLDETLDSFQKAVH